MLLCCRLQYDGALLQRAGAASLPHAGQRRSGSALCQGPGRQVWRQAFCCGMGCFSAGLERIRSAPVRKENRFFAGNPAFISLSHSGDYAACADCSGPGGGGYPADRAGSARGQFGVSAPPGNLPGWNGSRTRQRAAIALWALKESYLKASGALTEAVFAAEFQIEAGGGAAGPAGWRFFLDRRIEGYLLAVCEKD